MYEVGYVLVFLITFCTSKGRFALEIDIIRPKNHLFIFCIFQTGVPLILLGLSWS